MPERCPARSYTPRTGLGYSKSPTREGSEVENVEESVGTKRRLASFRAELLIIRRSTGRVIVLESNRYPQGWRYRVVDINHPIEYFEWLTFEHMKFFIRGLSARAQIEEKR
jgi:hypothetical protein